MKASAQTKTSSLLLDEKATPKPIECWYLMQGESSASNVDFIRKSLAEKVALNIQSLLDRGATLSMDKHQKPIRLSDIAVLCRYNHEVTLIKRTL